LHPSLAWICEYLKTVDLAAIPPGRHALSEGIALLREDYQTREPIGGGFEYHRRHADLQIVLSGEERFAVASKNHGMFLETVAYDREKDVAKGDVGEASFVLLKEGMFALVFPYEYHQPKIRTHTSSAVVKAVFKIAL
jgi:YhcH/YjgK/YiaL family protein